MSAIAAAWQVLGVLLTVVGLGIATVIRSIDFEDMGSLVKTAAWLMVASWVSSYLWAFIFTDTAGPMVFPGWHYFAKLWSALLVTNTIALGVISLFVSGFKIHGFFGLLVAGVVVTVVENGFMVIQLVQLCPKDRWVCDRTNYH